jgi:hypothetical protein
VPFEVNRQVQCDVRGGNCRQAGGLDHGICKRLHVNTERKAQASAAAKYPGGQGLASRFLYPLPVQIACKLMNFTQRLPPWLIGRYHPGAPGIGTRCRPLTSSPGCGRPIFSFCGTYVS